MVPGIHALTAAIKDVDGRDKPGHDEERESVDHYEGWYHSI